MQTKDSKTNKSGYLFSITRETKNGILEYLTNEGFRSEEAIQRTNVKVYRAQKSEVYKKLTELKKQLRPAGKRLLKVNY